MRRKRLEKELRRHLQVKDFICSRCRVQATRETDRICEICKALGKSAEPIQEEFSAREFLLQSGLFKAIYLRFEKWKIFPSTANQTNQF